MSQVQEIQACLRTRIQNPEHAITEQAGVIAEINVEEGGFNESEGTFAGITQQAWDEYRLFDTTVGIECPADFQDLPPDAAATLIYNFNQWFFTKPPETNFWALPKLLWLVCCDTASIDPAPVIFRIQRLIGDPKPDGIWGSATTARVQEFFANKTTTDIVQFAKDFSELISMHYAEKGETNVVSREVSEHLTARCNRKYETLLNYVETRRSTAENVSEVMPEQIQQELATENAPMPESEVIEAPVNEVATTPAAPNLEGFQSSRNLSLKGRGKFFRNTEETKGVVSKSQQANPPLTADVREQNLTKNEKVSKPMPEQEVTIADLVAELQKQNILFEEFIALQKQLLAQAPETQEQQNLGGAAEDAADIAKKILAAVDKNFDGSMRDSL